MACLGGEACTAGVVAFECCVDVLVCILLNYVRSARAIDSVWERTFALLNFGHGRDVVLGVLESGLNR